jgi:hypothetical protein
MKVHLVVESNSDRLCRHEPIGFLIGVDTNLRHEVMSCPHMGTSKRAARYPIISDYLGAY